MPRSAWIPDNPSNISLGLTFDTWFCRLPGGKSGPNCAQEKNASNQSETTLNQVAPMISIFVHVVPGSREKILPAQWAIGANQSH